MRGQKPVQQPNLALLLQGARPQLRQAMKIKMTDNQILETTLNMAEEYKQRAERAESAMRKRYCALVDNGTDGFEMHGFFKTKFDALSGIEDENHQLWDILTGELLEERWQ